MPNKPILCIDFDGVLHSYASGWKGADVIPDPMVEGAAEFLVAAVTWFRIAVFSSRSNQPGGLEAMQRWLRTQLHDALKPVIYHRLFEQIEWPTEKPPTKVTIDDRAVTFTGQWPSLIDLLAFEPWNKRTEPVDDRQQSFAEFSREKDGGLAAEAVEILLRGQNNVGKAAE